MIYRLIKNTKLKGFATKKNELLGIFNMTGLSSKVNFFYKLSEEIKIRLSNKESFIKVFSIMTVFIIYHFTKKIQNGVFGK